MFTKGNVIPVKFRNSIPFLRYYSFCKLFLRASFATSLEKSEIHLS